MSVIFSTLFPLHFLGSHFLWYWLPWSLPWHLIQGWYCCYLKLGQLNIWPSRNLLMRQCQRILRQSTLQQGWSLTAQRFAAKWVPSNLLLNSELFSSYKHHTTLREKWESHPRRPLTFIGQLYTVSISHTCPIHPNRCDSSTVVDVTPEVESCVNIPEVERRKQYVKLSWYAGSRIVR